MIHYLKGRVNKKNDKSVIIEVAGVGYKVFCPPFVLKQLLPGREAKIFTFLHLKEKSMELYGFCSLAELDIFVLLNGVSGVGPRTAMMLASFGSLEKLKEAIEKNDLSSEIKGIGKKKMQKILLELTGKIKELKKTSKESETDDALNALVSLGFPAKLAKTTLKNLPKNIQGTEQRVKAALNVLGRA